MLDKYQDVTKEDVIDILRKYFLPLFDAKSSVVVSVTAPGKVEEIAENLKASGYDVEKRTLTVEPGEDDESGSESGSGSEDSDN